MTTGEILCAVKEASRMLAGGPARERTQALYEMANALEREAETILAANARDVEAARGTVSDVMLDRLRLDRGRIDAMAAGVRAVAALPDPVGRELRRYTRPDGLEIRKVSVPMGVIGIIYESRPNVTSDAAALAVKSGSGCVLRCGKEAHGSCAAITAALRAGLEKAGLPGTLVMLVEDTSRASAEAMMRANGYIDLLIPRGGAGLIRACVEKATVPCIETGTGICHVYVDRWADLDKAVRIVVNAKTSRPSVCNAAEVCVVHRDVAARFLPMLERALVTERRENGLPPVELRADAEALPLLQSAVPAGENDFDTEFLDYILAVRVVGSVEEAAAHVRQHSTGHSEAIITEDRDAADVFIAETDSAAVYVNASTRFTDGGEFGLGCEMGISTQKLHARGPMGLEELTTYKYIVTGDGHVR